MITFLPKVLRRSSNPIVIHKPQNKHSLTFLWAENDVLWLLWEWSFENEITPCLKFTWTSYEVRNNKQLFFEIEVNILPLFTEIEKNNCFSIYTGSDLNNVVKRKPLKIDLIDLSIQVKTCFHISNRPLPIQLHLHEISKFLDTVSTQQMWLKCKSLQF